MSPTILRAGGYRFYFFSREEPRPHVHVQHATGEAKYWLDPSVFPWFADASIRALANVQLPSPNHLYWPDLDIDLSVDSIEHPERYPLVSKQTVPKA